MFCFVNFVDYLLIYQIICQIVLDVYSSVSSPSSRAGLNFGPFCPNEGVMTSQLEIRFFLKFSNTNPIFGFSVPKLIWVPCSEMKQYVYQSLYSPVFLFTSC